VTVWDAGALARKRAAGAQTFEVPPKSFSRFALICGRDAGVPANHLTVGT